MRTFTCRSTFLYAGNISLQWLSFLPSQILIELELSQEVNSWQGLPVASKLLRCGLGVRRKTALNFRIHPQRKSESELYSDDNSMDSYTRFSTSGFYHESVSTGPPSTIGPFAANLYENSRKYSQLWFYRRGQIIAGVVATCDKLLPVSWHRRLIFRR